MKRGFSPSGIFLSRITLCGHVAAFGSNKGMFRAQMPVKEKEDRNEHHSPEGQFIWRQDEDNCDEAGVNDRDRVYDVRFFSQIPWSHLGRDELAGFFAAVPPVKIDGDDVGEIKRDRADGGDDVVSRGINAEQNGEETGHPNCANWSPVLAADALQPA